MEPELRNRIARRMLSDFLAYSLEFGTTDATIEPDQYGLTAKEFWIVGARLRQMGLVRRSGEETCCATKKGLELAASSAKLAELFPIVGDPSAPLPSELRVFGSRPFDPIANAPPSMTWEDYSTHLQVVWPRLLNSSAQNDEAKFQSFLEKHPCLLPASFECFRRGATPEIPAYFTQPELPGFRAKIPDFMTITFDSDAVIALLIEIEAPAKRWANSNGTPSAKLTQALDQLRSWKAWFREPENVLQFTKLYGIDARTLETHQFIQRYALIYGRRAEAQANAAFAKKRALIAQDDEVLMTYDRLTPSDRMGPSPTVRLDRSGPDAKVSIVHVPPTLKFGPFERFYDFTGLSEAIGRNDLMTKDRRDFLVRRSTYWKEWMRKTPIIDDRFHTTEFYQE